MFRKHLLGALALPLLFTACTTKQAPSLAYPATVLAAHQQAHYRTALWCVYTSHLNSSVLERSAPADKDSLQAILRQLLRVQRPFKQLENKGTHTRFRFDADFTSPTTSALINRLYYTYVMGSHRYSDLDPILDVWVNNQNGIIDSVKTYSNHIVYAGPVVRKQLGKWIKIGPPDSRKLPYNLDEPCKTTFLQQHQDQLNPELRQLCWDKGILSR